MNSKSLENITLTVCKLDDKDTVIKELRDKTTQDGWSSFRLWLPATIGTMDFRTDRINVYVTKEDGDKSYKISRISVG